MGISSSADQQIMDALSFRDLVRLFDNAWAEEVDGGYGFTFRWPRTR